jgi:hypothetical protein
MLAGSKIERKENAIDLGSQVHLHSLVVDRGVSLEEAQDVLAEAKVANCVVDESLFIPKLSGCRQPIQTQKLFSCCPASPANGYPYSVV